MGKWKTLVAGAAAAGVVAAGVVALVRADGEPGIPTLEERWVSEPMPTVWEPSQVRGTWVVEDSVVTVTERGSWAFETATGEQRWALTSRENSLEPCFVSPEPNDIGIIAIVFKAVGGGRCDVVGALHTHTGELLWSRQLPEALGPTARREIPVNTGAEVITVDVRDAGSHHRFSLDGAALPLPVPSGLPDGCSRRTKWVQGAEHTLARCWDTLTAFDTGSGEELWTRRGQLPPPPQAVLPGVPLVVIGSRSATSFGPDGEVTGEAMFETALDGIPLRFGESLLVAPSVSSGGLGLGSAGFAPHDGDPWVLELGDAVPAGAGDDHVLVVSPTGGGNGEQALLRVYVADGEPAEDGVFPSAPVLGAAIDEESLYIITTGDSPRRRGDARMVAFSRP